MSKSEAKELRKIQKELCDQLVTDVDELDRIIERQLRCREGFYNYSIGNILLADQQLYARTGETTELLAGYNAWQKHGRFVRKGQKALKILAPRIWRKEDEESGEIEEILYFVKVNVWDLSMTDGEPMEESMVVNRGTITFQDILERSPVEIKMSNKQLTRGSTDGTIIKISSWIPDDQKVAVFFHEYIHYLCHFTDKGKKLSTGVKELMAEAGSYYLCRFCNVTNMESAAYIRNWNKENAVEDLKGYGGKIISTCDKIIKEMKLHDFVEAKD